MGNLRPADIFGTGTGRMNTCYPGLSSLMAEAQSAQGVKVANLSVCIVTPDLLGPVKNGGIGTACAHLAYALAEAGHKMHILFSQCGYTAPLSTDSADHWQRSYTERGIAVTLAEDWDKARGPVSYFPNHPPQYMTKVVHDWLAEQPPFDLVLFMEWQGHAFYALHAKQCGLRFTDTALVAVVHSPSVWHSIHNADLPAHPLQSCTWHMERETLTRADAVISPSAYMLDWCLAQGFTLPQHVFAQPNLLHLEGVPPPAARKPINEVVFFGRLEYRKGLEQFCTALDRLAAQKRLPRQITFLGKLSHMGEEHAALYIARRAKQWKKARVSILPHYNQPQAVAYLTGPGRLAVMPSVADNSPYTVYECLLAGIPFLARAVGGVAELVHPEDRAACLFGDNPQELAEKMALALGKAPTLARLAFDTAQNQQAWVEGLPALVARLRHQRGQKPPPAAPPFISVCLTHYMRPHLLQRAVASLQAQTYPHFEVILADDGSPDKASRAYLDTLTVDFDRRGWQILRLQNGYPGKARNAAVQTARGEWLVFFDDDNVALPHMLHSFATGAVHAGAELLTAAFEVFEEGAARKGANTKDVRKFFLPLGNMVAYSTIHNTLGDTTSMISRRLFTEMGGFSEDYGLGHEDFELFLRVVLAGKKVAVMPEPLFRYRVTSGGDSIQQRTNAAANRMRSLRPFMEMLPPALADLALMTHGMAQAQHTAGYASEDELFQLVHQQSHICGDPSAPEVIAAVADALLAQGHKTLARQLLSQLEERNALPPMQSDALRAHARRAAAKGNIKQVREYLQKFSELDNDSIEKAAFYRAILDALPARAALAPLRLEVVHALSAADDGSIAAPLTVAAHSLRLGHAPLAAATIRQALDRAESLYFTHRPDVRAAVLGGQFTCALHHYVLYRDIDRTPWPDEKLFRTVFQDYPTLPRALAAEDPCALYLCLEEAFCA